MIYFYIFLFCFKLLVSCPVNMNRMWNAFRSEADFASHKASNKNRDKNPVFCNDFREGTVLYVSRPGRLDLQWNASVQKPPRLNVFHPEPFINIRKANVLEIVNRNLLLIINKNFAYKSNSLRVPRSLTCRVNFEKPSKLVNSNEIGIEKKTLDCRKILF